MRWTVETLNETVDAELAALPTDMRARLTRIAELIEAVGMPSVTEPHVRHIRGPIWEIRLTERPASPERCTSPPKRSAL
jgi:Phage derived protein Gp49-like (DUF891)